MAVTILCCASVILLSEVLSGGFFSPRSAEDTHVIRKECQETNINVIVRQNLFQLPWLQFNTAAPQENNREIYFFYKSKFYKK